MTFDEAKRALFSGKKIRLQGQKGYTYLEDGIVFYKSPDLPRGIFCAFTEKDKRATDWEITE